LVGVDSWIVVARVPIKQVVANLPALIGVIQYVLGLRGEDCPLMDLLGTRTNTVAGKRHATEPHGVIALLVRFKGEQGELCHLMPLPLLTDSGVKPMIWVDRMLEYYEEIGVLHGLVFRDAKGQMGRYGDFEYGFLQRMAACEGKRKRKRQEPEYAATLRRCFSHVECPLGFSKGDVVRDARLVRGVY
jgi:hypothetical protein